MIIDGKKIAEGLFRELTETVRQLSSAPQLAVITCAPNFETQRFLNIKQKRAAEVGIVVRVIELPETATTDECVQTIAAAATDSDGVVVQLPFPGHVDRDALIAAIPKTHDVDAFNLEDSEILPPVIGAMHMILTTEGIVLEGKRVVVVGAGKLVGQPAARWFRGQYADVTVLTKEDSKEVSDIAHHTKDADIVVLGTGVPGLLKPDMVHEGVVILDAGTSEDAGELRGDADPACAEKALIFTPVPGGIGPITIAILLKNLVTLATRSIA
ncbi:bifunctional 5,10-methylenetetrahydrofolate dehydrogenase/5,10-methenyltetrahydrofolate cyclohydrolase [Candidatus Kaiserbacteria bacterium]|nr:bifunctional 5,10-methylenetetrahydrofolate dehydrogenase/5,10-methenyltetrahydrofolate cyclohydrolase [Candidatus Kaiserbacteria bacterium]